MSCASEFVPQLRSRGFRMTPQRMVILHVLHHERIHLSPACDMMMIVPGYFIGQASAGSVRCTDYTVLGKEI